MSPEGTGVGSGFPRVTHSVRPGPAGEVSSYQGVRDAYREKWAHLREIRPMCKPALPPLEVLVPRAGHYLNKTGVLVSNMRFPENEWKTLRAFPWSVS